MGAVRGGKALFAGAAIAAIEIAAGRQIAPWSTSSMEVKA
jgi:hypothetical protein